jgi:LacI family transcriptional regulator
MKDIAEALNVSVVTVSKAMRGHPDIGKKTRERVLEYAKAINYRPNLMARSLVTGRSSLVGLVVPDLIHPFFSEIAKSLSAALRNRHFFLVVASSDNDPQLEQAEINHMLEHRLGALVLATCQQNAADLEAVNREGPPLVLLDRSIAGLSTNFVGADDYQVGAIATEHLLRTGRKRIAHIRGPENNVGQRRLEGYRETLRRHRIPVQEQYVVRTRAAADDRSSGERAMEQLLALRPRPDAVFCFNDALAIAAIARVFSAGLRVPQDVAIVGCGNYHYDDVLRISLSSVDQRTEEIGKRTAKMIFRLLDAKETGRPRRLVLEPRLIVRASS